MEYVLSILVLNSGSSSIKFSVYAPGEGGADPALLLDGELSGVGGAKEKLTISRPGAADQTSPVDAGQTLHDAIHSVLDVVAEFAPEAIGYRIVHPGPTHNEHERITPKLLQDLKAAVAFAPLHDPSAIEVIHETMQRFPAAGHFACFDTVFHRTMPAEATTYALPAEYRKQGVRRYGFHGLSCESVVWQMKRLVPLPQRMVIAHLGSGCSVTALRNGESVDTSMGMTPTGGLVMGTRPGDLDPGALLFLFRKQDSGDAATELQTMLNKQSGMVALTNLPNDMRGVRRAAEAGDAQALLALKIFTRSIRKTIGGYAWLLGGLDAIVFTGGIGEHDATTRSEVLAGLEAMGIALDNERNSARMSSVREVHASGSATPIYIFPAQEDLMIARHVEQLSLLESHETQPQPEVCKARG